MKKLLYILFFPIILHGQIINTDKGKTPTSIEYSDTSRASSVSDYAKFGVLDTNLRAVSGVLFVPQDTAPPHVEGTLYYDKDEKALSYFNNESDVTLNIGLENIIYVRALENITNGHAVYIAQAAGPVPRVRLANNNSDSTVNAIGLATHDISSGAYGWVTSFGIVRHLDTDTFTEGATIYVDTLGNLTDVKPAYPKRIKQIGNVIYSHANQGKILVNPVLLDLNNLPEHGVVFGNGGGRGSVDEGNFDYYKDKDSLYVKVISADSFQLNVGQWNDLVISGTIANTGSQAPSLRGFRGSTLVQRYAMQGSVANDDFNFEFQLPHATVRNDIGYPHLHYAPETDPGTTDTMVLKFSYTQADIHGAFGAVTDTTIIVPLGARGAWEHGLIGFGYINTGNLSQVTLCNIQRLQNNVHDTYTGWIHILSVDMHVRINKFGSRNERTD
jgi:hypothetical protein